MIFTVLMILVALGVLALAAMAVRIVIGGDSGKFTTVVLALSGLFGVTAVLAFFFSCIKL